MPTHFSYRSTAGFAAVLGAVLSLCSLAAHADATLARIKERGKVVVGVNIGGSVFGSVDPATQQLVGTCNRVRTRVSVREVLADCDACLVRARHPGQPHNWTCKYALAVLLTAVFMRPIPFEAATL